jgi:hypothetical protein
MSTGLRKLHLALFVYGNRYLDICTSIVLPNLAALIGELSDDLRGATELRVLTDPSGRQKLEAALGLARIRTLIPVKIADTMEYAGYELYGNYGPMIRGQARLVRDASLEKAGIIFCPPDLVWSRGSFAVIAKLAQQGYRAVIGPSARGIEEELVPIFRDRIAQAGGDRLEISSGDLTGLLFSHWQQMNDCFIWNAASSNAWKSYTYWRVGERQLLMKCWQGPALCLWPFREVRDYDGWIDHRLIESCVCGVHEIHVVPDATDIQTLDMAPRDRREAHHQVSWKRWHLFKQLLNRKRHCRYNILYGRQPIRIYDVPIAEEVWREAERRFSAETHPAMYVAIAIRPLLASIDGAWRHSGMAAATRMIANSASGLRPRTRIRDLQQRLRLRTRIQNLRYRLRLRTRMGGLRGRLRGVFGLHS